MTYQELIEKCKQGYTGLIPKWLGYLDWDYNINQIYFHYNDYRLNQDELENKFKINERTDLYYII